MNLVLVSLLAAVVSGGPAESAPAPETRAPEAAPAKEEKVICRRIEHTGTRVGRRRVCLTERQWKFQEDQDERLVDRIQQRGGNGNVQRPPSSGF